MKNDKQLFNGTVSTWKREKYEIQLKPNVKPYHAKAYPIPKAYETVLCLEVERLCKMGVLKKVNFSDWVAPTFIISKKDNTVRFITNLREINKRIKRKLYPLTKIQELLL